MIKLRDMQQSDIENYVRWFTKETEWLNWDSPWEPFEMSDEETERQNWTKYYEAVRDLAEIVVRQKLEIEYNGKHIGWVCSYTDLEYLENPKKIAAIGLDIPEVADRKNGCGTEAMRLYMEYLRRHGHKSFYTQTWSGNTAMMRVAEKLGFKETARIKDHREVNGEKYDAVTYRIDL